VTGSQTLETNTMTTEQSASMDAALNDVFSPGRGRHEDTAQTEVAEAIPTPAPTPEVEAAPQPEAQREDPVDHNKTVSVKEVFDEREKKRAYKAKYEEETRLRIEADTERKLLREQLERFMRAPQPAAQPQPQPRQQVRLPDLNQDPEGYIHAVLQMQRAELEQARLNDHLNGSEDRAREKHGNDVVNAALEAAKDLNPADIQRLYSLRHPYDELVKWHRSQETLKKVGGDLQGFLTKHEEELTAKILADLKAGRLNVGGQPSAQPAPQAQHFPGTLAAATQQGPTGQITKTLGAAVGDVFSTDRKDRGMARQ
jgi:hypothetical protein